MRDFKYYLHSAIVGLIVFGACVGYLKWLAIPGEMNKAAADTAIILIGMSMWLTSICYFWNFLDWAIIYRKYFGLVGFAFAVAHLLLSWSPFLTLLVPANWQAGRIWPLATGAVALLIFTAMALISNSAAAKMLGGKRWRQFLRVGYGALMLVWAHVVLLKSSRWVTWYQEGMTTPPSLSFLVTIFMVIVVVMRLAMWWSIRSQKKDVSLSSRS